MNAYYPIVLAMGTRPEIIKMAPVALALQAQGVPVEIVHTGQHDETTSRPLYQFFGLEPRYQVQLERRKPTLAALSSELLEKLSDVFTSIQPAAVLVHGDTSSALMAALAAFYQNIPIGHVEAGLRSGSLTEPFPEEMNRSVIGRLARWHFSPTTQAVENLQREGITENVLQVGNTVVDAVQWAAKHVQEQATHIAAFDWWQQSGCRELIVVTAHRRENWDNMNEIAHAVVDLLTQQTSLAVVWALHPNPAVQNVVRAVYAASSETVRQRWLLTEPLNYPAMVALMSHADVLLTDSGGIQEEGVSLHKPVLVLRNVTERPELIECGGGILVGTQRDDVVQQTLYVLNEPQIRQDMQSAVNPFGDGHTADYIAKRLVQDLYYSHSQLK